MINERKANFERSFESSEKLDFSELTGEQLESVIRKVQDINRPGIAFSAISLSETADLKNIFRAGLLGDSGERKSEDQFRPITPASWAASTRKRRDTALYVNITGRGWRPNQKDPDCEIAQTSKRMGEFIGATPVVVLFDIKPYRELSVTGESLATGPVHTFIADDPRLRREWEWLSPEEKERRFTTGKQKQLIPSSEYGFKLFHRIAPRDFLGIVIKPYRKLTMEQLSEWAAEYDIHLEDEEGLITLLKDNETLLFQTIGDKLEDNSPEGSKTQAGSVILAMMQENLKRPELNVPIYDRRGNLIWPKQMSHEEVKKFVAERDNAKNIDPGSNFE